MRYPQPRVWLVDAGRIVLAGTAITLGVPGEAMPRRRARDRASCVPCLATAAVGAEPTVPAVMTGSTTTFPSAVVVEMLTSRPIVSIEPVSSAHAGQARPVEELSDDRIHVGDAGAVADGRRQPHPEVGSHRRDGSPAAEPR